MIFAARVALACEFIGVVAILARAASIRTLPAIQAFSIWALRAHTLVEHIAFACTVSAVNQAESKNHEKHCQQDGPDGVVGDALAVQRYLLVHCFLLVVWIVALSQLGVLDHLLNYYNDLEYEVDDCVNSKGKLRCNQPG